MVDESIGRASVVIPTFRRKASIGEVIEPLLQDPATGEIVVVIDGSQDGTLEYLTAWAERDDRIRPIYQPNAGQEAARQRGIEASHFDIVVLLDDDVRAEVGLIGSHVRHHANADRLLVLGYMPVIVPKRREPGQVATFLYAQDYEATCKLYELDSRNVTTHLWAGNMSLRRDVAIEIGMLSSTKLGYHEDMRFGMRCQRSGVAGVFDRSLLAHHSHSRSVAKFALECRLSGEGRATLSVEYPELRNEIDPAHVLPRLGVLGFRLLSLPVIEPLTSGAMLLLVYIAGRMRLWSVETMGARILRQIKMFSGWSRGLRGARND